VSHDEVSQGYDGEQQRSYGWLLILAAAIVVALVSLAGHHTRTTATPRPPVPSAFATPSVGASAAASASPSATPSEVPSDDPVAAVLAQISGYVSVGEVCAPVTDGRTTLTVRFLLRNVTGLPEQLLTVTPELPMGGLRPRGTAVQGGTCADPVGTPAPPSRNAMPEGGTLVVSLSFALPKTCPAPYPVQAVVTVAIGGVQRLDTVALYTDLGTVKFDLCTAQPTA
jgi:hypothetical protein